ncbi:MAG: hypothetical protein KGJ07_05850, partial [Patescibacteria group bacterium]|nr:hypothetical protein [Patescibacteria group bacterium]
YWLCKHYVSTTVVMVGIGICILWYPAYICWQIARDFIHAPILAEEQNQYTRNVGWGKAGAVNFFCLQVASGQKIVVGTYRGEDVTLQTYLGTNPYITFVSYSSDDSSVTKQLDVFAHSVPTYLVTFNTHNISPKESTKFSRVFTNPQTSIETAFSIYKIRF